MIGKRVSQVWLFLSMLALLSACSLPGSGMPDTPGITPAAPATGQTPAAGGAPTSGAPTEIPTAIPTVVHKVRPGEPPAGFESQIQDADTSSLASQHRANGGENYANDQFERPFDQSMNTYYPDLDIQAAGLNREAAWVYVTLTLAGQDPQAGMPMDYGVEIDTNLDGRGDYLVMAQSPGKAWSTDGVRAWKDADHDVGGPHPVQADVPPQTGTSYETQLFDQGQGTDPDLAWARLSPADTHKVQIAFKRSLFPDPGKYLWGAWAIDPAMFHPDWFDYNDHFTQAEAGSPLTELAQYYPLKAFYAADNTCRWAVGFTPTGSEPGVCPVPVTPTPRPTLTSQPSLTPIKLGNIAGLVYYDTNGNGAYNNPPDHPIGGATIRIRSGSCASPGSLVTTGTTAPDGGFSFSVPAGTYCVDVHPNPSGITWTQKFSSATMSVVAGGGTGTQFWYRKPVIK